MELTEEDLINRADSAPDTFEIMLSGKEGDFLLLKNIKDYRETERIKEKTKSLLKLSENGTYHPTWKPYMPITPGMAEVMATLVTLSITPKFSDYGVLRFLAKNGMLALLIENQMRAKIMLSMQAHELSEIEKEKNALTPTESDAPTSPPAGTTSTSTRRNSRKKIGALPAPL